MFAGDQKVSSLSLYNVLVWSVLCWLLPDTLPPAVPPCWPAAHVDLSRTHVALHMKARSAQHKPNMVDTILQ